MSKKDKYFVISDLEALVNSARSIVYNNFGNWSEQTNIDIQVSDENQSEMDNVLSYNESLVIIKNIVKKQKHKFTNNIRYILTEQLFLQILEELNQRMTSNIITSLLDKGLIETAFDDTKNDFVFWVKDEKFKAD